MDIKLIRILFIVKLIISLLVVVLSFLLIENVIRISLFFDIMVNNKNV